MIVPSSRPDPSLSDRERRLDEAIAEYLLAAEAGRVPDRRAFLARYPDLADDLAAFFDDEDCVRGLAGTVPMSGEDARGRTPFLAGGGAEADAGPGVGGELGDFVLLEEIAARRHGRRLQGEAEEPEPRRRAQDDPAVGLPAGRRRGRAVPHRGRGGRPARSSRDRADLRDGRAWPATRTSASS